MSKTIYTEVHYRCDNNSCRYSARGIHIAGNPDKTDQRMRAAGWIVKEDGTCYCPDCAKNGGQ